MRFYWRSRLLSGSPKALSGFAVSPDLELVTIDSDFKNFE